MSIDKLGNRIRRKLPVWMQGDVGTWVQHTIVAAAFTALGAGLGYLLGEWRAGARIFAIVGAGYYWKREGRRTTPDSVMDRAGPTLVAVTTWLL